MVDIRERGLTTSKDHLEYLEQRLKSFSKKNNSNIYIAKLITPKTQNPDLVLEKKQRHKALQHINFEYFFTESQAITWLKANQAA
ncbi:MAG: hypothetical protein LPK19_10250 [Hymenobacteraceae bacterium]|nr:hypothetical protein [Hymenobacteraceae bacterium]MDX5396604.1 hypothetical protein [Hymenobacteraceae bacterium]MDX5512667.1 hypothetical protein [Hymenobacteraceae bacterium]